MTKKHQDWNIINVRKDLYEAIQALATKQSTPYHKISAAYVLDTLIRKQLTKQAKG